MKNTIQFLYYKIFWLIIIAFLCTAMYAQEYLIVANQCVEEYSIDRYTDEIYYQNCFTEDVFRTSSIGSYHILTDFPDLPIFANNNHVAAYIDWHNYNDIDLYLYDFDNDTSYFLANLPYSGAYLFFSPSDEKILIGAQAYYSFEDSSVHYTGISLDAYDLEWVTDTTFLFLTYEEAIGIVNLNNYSIDTLVHVADTIMIMDKAYNENINAFAYVSQYWDDYVYNALINIYYLENGTDSVVYNWYEDGPWLYGFLFGVSSISWEKKSNKLGFIGNEIINPFSWVFVFDYSTFKTNLYTDENTFVEAVRYNLQWLNRDTVIYSDYYDGMYLYGLDVTKPVNVSYNNEEKNSDYSLYQNFPNPFNPLTKIAYQLPRSGNVVLKVYDILGREVTTLVNEFKSEGRYEINFDASSLTSGVYIYQLRTENYVNTKKMILLK